MTHVQGNRISQRPPSGGRDRFHHAPRGNRVAEQRLFIVVVDPHSLELRNHLRGVLPGEIGKLVGFLALLTLRGYPNLPRRVSGFGF